MACTEKPEKAIFLLKCLGKVFPDLPYLEVKYTKKLANCNTVQELLSAHSQQQYRQSVHIVSNAYLDALAARDIPLFLQEKKDQAHIIYSSDSVINAPDFSQKNSLIGLNGEDKPMRPTIQKYKEKREKVLEYSNVASQKLEILLKNRDRNGFSGFSLCSDPLFLIVIAKISCRYNVGIPDGLAATEDYLEIVENPLERLKGSYYKAMLLYLNHQVYESKKIMQEVLPLLKDSSLNNKYNRVFKILNKKN